MKLHLPVLLRKSVLSCLAAVALCTLGSGVAWAENLSFEGATLTWDTQAESFTNEDKVAAAFAPGDDVSFTRKSNVTLGEDISAGTVAIEKGADVTIDLDVFELKVDRIELSGLLDMGCSLNIGAGTTLAMNGAGAVLDSNLILGEEGVLSVTGAGGSLNGHSLTLQEGASLILTGAVLSRETTDVDQDGELSLIVTPTGDGKTYTLLTGVSALVDKEGNALTAGSYSTDDLFDSSQPGAGFWAGGTLVYAADGTLTLIRHNEIVKDALDVTSRQTRSVDYSYYKGISFKELFSSSYGGAIYGGYDSTIMLSNNGSVSFSGNTASSSSSASGGAIYGKRTITLSGNGSVSFSENTANSSYDDAHGGAIYGSSYSTITLSGNGSVSFSGNTASGKFAYGGAIYGDDSSSITLSDNGSVSFSGNTASGSSDAYGGAIRVYGHLFIQNNDSVLFEKNVEKSGSSYRLRSIDAGGSGNVISLSAAEGKSIEFRDSVYIASGSTFNLNADYTDDEGVVHKQTGDIIFTGAYTEADLLAVKGSKGTAAEILNSRTSEVYTQTKLYGGRLRVEDGAIYQGQGIIAHAGSEATVLVKDATLSHSGYDLTFNAGTTLELVGDSKLAGNLMMLSGSILSLDSTMNLNGSLTLGNEVVLGGGLLDDILSMKAGDTLTLVSGLESLHLQTQSLIRSLEYITLLSGELVNASDYFVNLKGYSGLVFSYDSNTQTLNVIYAIPEPTTTTLSLLALAALAARRRRK